MKRNTGESIIIRVKYKKKGEYPTLKKNAKKAKVGNISEYIRSKTL